MVRIIEDILPMRFEQLRRAAQMVHLKVTKGLDGIPNGIAEFETTLEDFEAVGGDRSSDQARNSDLLAILPGKLQTDLLWNSTNPEWSYAKFRDHVLTQSARIVDLDKNLSRRRAGGVHAVDNQRDDSQPPPLGKNMREDEEEDEMNLNPISSLEELLAMVNRTRAAGFQQRDRRPGAGAPTRRPQPRGDGDRQRAPRKCANCGKEHEQRACPILRSQSPTAPAGDGVRRVIHQETALRNKRRAISRRLRMLSLSSGPSMP